MDQTVSPLYISNFYPLIKRLKAENDYVVVQIHWGTEYALTETKVQTNIAHSLIDNGADVIFGHHPHVIEPVRIYKGKVIFYSLGNFVFDQVGLEQTQGIGAGVEFGETKNTFTILPYKIKSFAPDFLKDKERDIFCEKYLESLVHTGCTFGVLQ
jgi:poly-gamma-glutamate synthesis protein (capsule biosynthesis protein)